MQFRDVSSCSVNRPTVVLCDDCAAYEPRSILLACLYPSWLFSKSASAVLNALFRSVAGLMGDGRDALAVECGIGLVIRLLDGSGILPVV